MSYYSINEENHQQTIQLKLNNLLKYELIFNIFNY